MAESPIQDRGQQRGTDLARLIVAVGLQDRAAFAALFEFYAPRVKAMMLRSGLPEAQAEDLAQDTLLAVWRKAHLFDPAGAGPSAWIYTIARNLRIDVLRRDQRTQRTEGEAMQEPQFGPPLPDAQLAAADLDARVRAGLTHLSAEQLQVITLSFFENKPHSEIAQALRLPLGTVKSRLRLAMQRLRDLLDDRQ